MIYHGNALDVLKTLENDSVDCVITSPPYYQLRFYAGIPDYIWDGDKDCEHEFEVKQVKLMHENRNNQRGTNEDMLHGEGAVFINSKSGVKSAICSKCGAWKGQLGLEPTYQMYLNHLLLIIAECKRVLKPTGTMWINLGDSYNSGIGGNDGVTNKALSYVKNQKRSLSQKDIPNKSLMLIPHRFAIRCIDELNLILRNDIIWAKRNGMPESVTDRFSKKHEFFFFFVKQQKYYFDLNAVRDKPVTENTIRNKGIGGYGEHLGLSNNPRPTNHELGKNPGDVSDFFDIPTQPSSEKHYATYNYKLIDKPILAGCPKVGTILDPFCGTGTTLVRAIQLNREAIGIEGSEEYYKIAIKRMQQEKDLWKLEF